MDGRREYWTGIFNIGIVSVYEVGASFGLYYEFDGKHIILKCSNILPFVIIFFEAI